MRVRDAISVGAFDPIGLWNGDSVVRVDLSGAVDSGEVGEVARQIEDVFGTMDTTASAGHGATEGGGAASELEGRSREDEETSKGQAARVGDLIAKVFDSEAPPTTSSELLRAMRRAGAAPSMWRLAWGVRFSDDLYSRGRVDINRAPREVLAAVPGIEAAAAESIVSRREGMSADALTDPTWPAREGILTPEQLEQAADWITTRSLQWRVRIEAAVLDVKDGGAEDRAGESVEGEARRPMGVVTLEVIVDAAADRVRVAYLRDVSLEDAVARMEQHQRAGEEESVKTEEDVESEPSDAAAHTPRGAGAGREATTRSERMAERARGDAEGGRVRRGDARARRAAGNLRGDGGGGSGRGGGGEEGTEASGGGARGAGEAGERAEKLKRPARRELEARDNRTGRWRP